MSNLWLPDRRNLKSNNKTSKIFRQVSGRISERKKDGKDFKSCINDKDPAVLSGQ